MLVSSLSLQLIMRADALRENDELGVAIRDGYWAARN
jgi:hypothetical protein